MIICTCLAHREGRLSLNLHSVFYKINGDIPILSCGFVIVVDTFLQCWCKRMLFVKKRSSEIIIEAIFLCSYVVRSTRTIQPFINVFQFSSPWDPFEKQPARKHLFLEKLKADRFLITTRHVVVGVWCTALEAMW